MGGLLLLNEEQQDDLTYNNKMEHRFSELLYTRCWCGIPLLYVFGNCQQLPPVGMYPISDLSSTPKIGSPDLQGLLVLKVILDSSEPGTRS